MNDLKGSIRGSVTGEAAKALLGPRGGVDLHGDERARAVGDPSVAHPCGHIHNAPRGDRAVAGGPPVEAALDPSLFEEEEVGGAAELGDEVVGDTAADQLPLDDAVVVGDGGGGNRDS